MALLARLTSVQKNWIARRVAFSVQKPLSINSPNRTVQTQVDVKAKSNYLIGRGNQLYNSSLKSNDTELLEEAQVVFRTAVDLLQRDEKEARLAARAWVNLGIINQKLNHLESAEECLTQAVKLYGGDEAQSHASILLAQVKSQRGNHQEAAQLSQQVLKTIGEKDALLRGTVLSNLSCFLAAQNQYGEAETASSEALSIFENNLGMENTYTEQCLRNLVNIYQAQDKTEDIQKLRTQWEQKLRENRDKIASVAVKDAGKVNVEKHLQDRVSQPFKVCDPSGMFIGEELANIELNNFKVAYKPSQFELKLQKK